MNKLPPSLLSVTAVCLHTCILTVVTFATAHAWNYHVNVRQINSPTRKLRCCGAQLSCNFGRFQDFANDLPFWGNLGAIGPLSTRNLSFPKFVAVCPKIATSCLHTYFHSRCHWARVARLMTLQRSLQYSLSLSWTKTFWKISNFCTSLGPYNLDRRCFVVRCQNFPKYQRTKVTFYIQNWAELRATLVQIFQICAQLLPQV